MQFNLPKIYLYLSFLFGTLLVFLTPPFRAPDEHAHLFRIIALSQGQLIGLPQTSSAFMKTVEEAEKKAASLITYRKVSDNVKYQFPEIAEYIKTPTQPADNIFTLHSHITAAVYSPAPYLSALPVAWIASHFSPSMYLLLYSSRAAIFLASTLLIYFALKILPVMRWQLFFISLLPQTVYIRSSLSADPLTLGYVFLFFAFFLRALLRKEALPEKEIPVFSILAFLICLCKTVYMFVPCVALLLSERYFSTRKQYLYFLFSVIALPFLTGILWNHEVMQFTSQFFVVSANNLTQISPLKANAHEQLNYILHHPVQFIWVITKTVYEQSFGLNYLVGMIGVIGCLDTYLLPNELYLPLALVIFLLPLSDSGREAGFSGTQRMFSLLLFLGISLLIYIILYATYNEPHAPIIQGVQGRYFTPLMPLFFLCIAKSVKRYTWLLYPFTFALVIISHFSLIYSLVTHDYVLPK